MTEVDGQEPLTLERAARELRIKARYPGLVLQRMLEAKEKQIGRPIMVRSGSHGKGRRYRVTLNALRKDFPELAPSHVDDLARGLKKYLDGLDRRIDERVTKHPKFQEIWDREEIIAKSVKELAKRVRLLASSSVGSRT